MKSAFLHALAMLRQDFPRFGAGLRQSSARRDRPSALRQMLLNCLVRPPIWHPRREAFSALPFLEPDPASGGCSLLRSLFVEHDLFEFAKGPMQSSLSHLLAYGIELPFSTCENRLRAIGPTRPFHLSREVVILSKK